MLRGNRNSNRYRCALALLAGGVLAAIAPAQAQAQQLDDDELSSITGWYRYSSVTADFLEGRVADGLRITDLEVASVSPLRFNAVLVSNSGDYAKTWWWYYGITSAQMTTFLNDNNARLIDQFPYDDGNGNTRFACVMIRNTGDDAATWGRHYNVSLATISGYLDDNDDMRLLDLDRYTIGGNVEYSAIYIRNTGNHARSWWWYYNITPAQVSSFLDDNNAMLTEIERGSAAGTYDVIMQRRPGGNPHWWWYYNVSADFVADAIGQNGARITDYKRTLVGSEYRYDVIMVNNSNALTTRIGDILRNGTDGRSGAYMKQVNGPEFAGLNENSVFEPASMIKILHHAYAMSRVQAGAISLTSPITVFSGYDGSCPQDTGQFSEPLATTLERMMENSDNARTQAVRARFGETAINNFASTLGLSSTSIHHRIGCAGGSDGAINDPNMFTLRDAGSLYEQIHTSLFTPANRQTLYTLMLDEDQDGLSTIGTIINEEAAAAGLPTQARNAFRDQTHYVRKGGSYTLCSSGCEQIQTRGGLVSLPSRSGCRWVERSYVVGTFVNDATNESNASSAVGTAFNEMVRDRIRAAMATWAQCPCDWNFDGPVNSQDFFDFLTDFFAGNADYNGDNATNSQDFFDFLTCFFSA